MQSISSAACVSNVTASTTNETVSQIGAAFRTALARIETRQMLTPEQKDGLEQLEQRLGAPVELRLRGDAGTPRFLEVPETANDTQSGSLTPQQRESVAMGFINTNRALLRLSDPAQEAALVSQVVDDQGRAHLRFAQSYNGLLVWPADFYVHLDPAGNVRLLDGAYVPTPKDVTTTPAINGEGAVDLARQAVEATASASVGTPELFIYSPGNAESKLAWRTDVTKSADQIWSVVVDALTGQTLNRYSLVRSGNVAGSGVDLLGVTRPLNVWQEGGTNYLVDASKPMFDPSSPPLTQPKGAILVGDMKRQASLDLADLASSSSRYSGWLRDGVSAAYNLSATYDYWFIRRVCSCEAEKITIQVLRGPPNR